MRQVYCPTGGIKSFLALLTEIKQQYFALTGLMPQGAFNIAESIKLTSNGNSHL
jgi:hypothetical protein